MRMIPSNRQHVNHDKKEALFCAALCNTQNSSDAVPSCVQWYEHTWAVFI